MFFELLVAIILGAVQGISEFLPISSTAHLLLTSNILSGGLDLGLSTSNFIQFGTLLAILVFYRNELSNLLNNIWINLTNQRQFKRFINNNIKWLKGYDLSSINTKDKYDILIFQLFIATTPLVITALLFRNLIESLRGDLINIAIFLIFGGILITFAEIIYLKRNKVEESSLFSFKQVLTIGIFQSFAILPGVSRSGSTLAGALVTGRNRKDGVYFSFLLSIPAILLVSIYDSVKVLAGFINGDISILPSSEGLRQISSTNFSLSAVSLIIAFASSYFVGMWCLKWLLKYLSSNDSKIFIYYRILIAVIITLFTYINL